MQIIDQLALAPVPDAEAVGVFHVVSEGETLTSICTTYSADLQEVAELNGIDNANIVVVGQTIFVPDVADSKSPPANQNDEAPKERIRQWKGQFDWPLSGVITSKFGIRNKRRHDGIDIAAPEGTNIKAASNGQVLYAGDQKSGYGLLIIIRHSKGMISVYAHNMVNLVSEGDEIKMGQIIARVGKTGRATGPHLHFEIRKGTKPRNPLFFLPKIK